VRAEASHTPFRVALLHGHNLLAIAIWLALARRELRRCILPAALALAGAALLASGALLGFTVRHGVLSLFGLHLFAAADVIAPGFADATGIALTMSFAFLQSVHYAMWLVGIPRADARTPGSPTFRMAWRNLARDLTRPGMIALVGCAVLIGSAGLLAPLRTRGVFLSLATFHAWLELALLAFFATRRAWGRPRVAARAAA
jgi:hypothetical protein